MRKIMYGLTLVMIMGTMLFFTCPLSSFAGTPFNVNISGDSKGIHGFDLSIGDYYRVPEREVVVVHERGIPEDELPVVFFLSQRAHVRPELIVDMRLRGMSWMDITLHYGMRPDIYYVPVKAVRHGPPYGHAYGYYKHKKHEWKDMRFSDEDIVNQVNTKFISEHHGYAPEKVMRSRSEGKHFADIDQNIRYEKQGKSGKSGKTGKQDWDKGGKGSKGKQNWDDGGKGNKGKDKEWKEEKHHGNGHGKKQD
jgi:hypothetical protein